MKIILVVLGVSLILAAVTIYSYGALTASPPLLLGSEGNQEVGVDYFAFFGFAFGGAGAIILLFTVLQWYLRLRPKVKSAHIKLAEEKKINKTDVQQKQSLVFGLHIAFHRVTFCVTLYRR